MPCKEHMRPAHCCDAGLTAAEEKAVALSGGRSALAAACVAAAMMPSFDNSADDAREGRGLRGAESVLAAARSATEIASACDSLVLVAESALVAACSDAVVKSSADCLPSVCAADMGIPCDTA